MNTDPRLRVEIAGALCLTDRRRWGAVSGRA
jgi:hypothetical protein